MPDTVFSFLDNFSFLSNSLPTLARDIIMAIVIFLFFLLLRKIFTRYIFNLVLKLFSKSRTELGEKILLAFEAPMRSLFVVLGLYLSLLMLPLGPGAQVFASKFFRSLIIILITWGLYNLQDVHSILFSAMQEKLYFQIDRILFPFLSKFLRIITVLFAITIIVQEWNYDVNGLIAGFGLGGLALAMAAKDALANIFGGIVIILDKPFSIGDWINTPSVEGTVEDINFRSTKVRTFAQAMVTVPNSTLANEPITNWSKMGKRQVSFHLGITYSTPKEKLEKCVSELRTMLEQHPGIHKETIYVNFENFGENSLNILIYFFTITTVWGEFLKVKEEINLNILEILEKEKVAAAFPSRSIYLENLSPPEGKKLNNSSE